MLLSKASLFVSNDSVMLIRRRVELNILFYITDVINQVFIWAWVARLLAQIHHSCLKCFRLWPNVHTFYIPTDVSGGTGLFGMAGSVWPVRSGRFGLTVSVWPIRSEPFGLSLSVWAFRSEPFGLSLSVWAVSVWAVSVWAFSVTGHFGLAVSIWGHFGHDILVHK